MATSLAIALGRASVVECAGVRDEAWFRAVYDANLRAVLGYALRRVSAPEDAADVSAEVFLVAWRRRDQLPEDADEVRAWLFGTARRVLANHRRGEERRGRLAERLREELARIDLSAEVPDDAIAVRRALSTLSADDRELLTLTSWEQLTPADISVALGVSPATVRTRLHRARRRLAAVLPDLRRDATKRSAVSGHVADDTESRGGPGHDA